MAWIDNHNSEDLARIASAIAKMANVIHGLRVSLILTDKEREAVGDLLLEARVMEDDNESTWN